MDKSTKILLSATSKEDILGEVINMPLSPETMRIILVTGMGCMAVIALFSLYKRNLSIGAFFIWALVAIIIPILGPLIAIIGPSRRS
jgi:hypothetical protein